jgi:hypothetical protein
MQVKVLNKLASARAKDLSVSSKILTDMIDGLDEAAVAVEIRLKIDQNHADLKGGYVYLITLPQYHTSFVIIILCASILSKELLIDYNNSIICRSFRDYGEAVLKNLDKTIESDPYLTKAAKNFEGVRYRSN